MSVEGQLDVLSTMEKVYHGMIEIVLREILIMIPGATSMHIVPIPYECFVEVDIVVNGEREPLWKHTEQLDELEVNLSSYVDNKMSIYHLAQHIGEILTMEGKEVVIQ